MGKNMRPGKGRASGRVFSVVLKGQAAGVAGVPVALLAAAAAGAGDDLLRPGREYGGGIRRQIRGLRILRLLRHWRENAVLGEDLLQRQQLVLQLRDPRFQPLDLLVLPQDIGMGAAGGTVQLIQLVQHVRMEKQIWFQIPGKSHDATSVCSIIAQKNRLEQPSFQGKLAVSLR